jgi:hypothetical protein
MVFVFVFAVFCSTTLVVVLCLLNFSPQLILVRLLLQDAPAEPTEPEKKKRFGGKCKVTTRTPTPPRGEILLAFCTTQFAPHLKPSSPPFSPPNQRCFVRGHMASDCPTRLKNQIIKAKSLRAVRFLLASFF